jgi:hypothetical protein
VNGASLFFDASRSKGRTSNGGTSIHQSQEININAAAATHPDHHHARLLCKRPEHSVAQTRGTNKLED